MDEEKEGKQADLLNKEKPRNHHDISRKKEKNEKAGNGTVKLWGKHFHR